MGFPLKIALTFLTSLMVALFILPRLSHIALKIGLLDYPGKRKVHASPTPLVGGLGMIIGLSFSSFLFIPLSNLRGFYAGIIMLVIAGFLDDFRELNHRWRFVAQAVAAVFMVYFSQVVLLSFGDLFSVGPIDLGLFAIPVTVFCAVGVINAINMIDGLDGLAGGVSLIAFISFAVLAYMNNQHELMFLSIALSGAVIGFLKYNWPPSKLFMGDAGSFCLGFSLAFLSIAITQKEGSLVPPMAALLILSVPIADTVTVMVRRIIKGRSPFLADKSHLHHLLLKFGLDKGSAVKTILFISAVLSSLGIIGTLLDVPDYYLFLLFSIYCLSQFLSSFYIREIVRLKIRHDEGEIR